MTICWNCFILPLIPVVAFIYRKLSALSSVVVHELKARPDDSSIKGSIAILKQILGHFGARQRHRNLWHFPFLHYFTILDSGCYAHSPTKRVRTLLIRAWLQTVERCLCLWKLAKFCGEKSEYDTKLLVN